MNNQEIHHAIYTRNNKTTEHFEHPQRNTSRMIQIFSFHLDTVDRDPKTFLIKPLRGKPHYYTARELQQKQKDPSLREGLFSDLKAAIVHARYALIIYEPPTTNRPTLFSRISR